MHLIGHHETGCAIEHYEDQLGAALDLYARLGVDQFKTGYVCDDGQVDRRNPTGAHCGASGTTGSSWPATI